MERDTGLRRAQDLHHFVLGSISLREKLEHGKAGRVRRGMKPLADVRHLAIQGVAMGQPGLETRRKLFRDPEQSSAAHGHTIHAHINNYGYVVGGYGSPRSRSELRVF